MFWALAQPRSKVLGRQNLSTWAMIVGEGAGSLMSTMSER